MRKGQIRPTDAFKEGEKAYKKLRKDPDLLDRLTNIEAQVVFSRFVLEQTLQSIATSHGVTREYIRQVQGRAVAKINAHNR